MNLQGDSMDIVNVCTAGLMLSSAALFAGNAVYDYKFGKTTTAAIQQFESGKPSSVIDDVLNQTLLVIAICTGIAFVFEELALRLQSIENVQAQYMVQFSLNVFILVSVQALMSIAFLLAASTVAMFRLKRRGLTKFTIMTYLCKIAENLAGVYVLVKLAVSYLQAI